MRGYPLRKSVQVCALLSILLIPAWDAARAAGSAKAGSERARVCEACHGLDGVSKIPEAPNLAGQIQNYLIEQLIAFQTGQRQNDQMSLIAKTLSRQDVDDLAAYYSAIEITVGKLPGR